MDATTLLATILESYAGEKLGIKSSTIGTYRQSVVAFSKWIGRDAMASDLSKPMMLDYLRQRLQKATPKTVKRERADLLRLWEHAATVGVMTEPPRIPTIPQRQKSPVAFTKTQIGRLWQAAAETTGKVGEIPAGAWWQALVATLYWTGARIGAALAIRWRDVDLESGTITLREETAKTGTGQRIRLHPQAAGALAKIQADTDLVFVFKRSRRVLYTHWRRILKRAGIPTDRDHGFHCLRRTCYSLIAAASDLDTAGAQLGHKSDLSRNYLDPTLWTHQQAAELLPPISLDPAPPTLRLFAG